MSQPLPPHAEATRSRPSIDVSEATTSTLRSPASRPTSPTKGMGGFVSSAMAKRSDSVSKRWSVQSGSMLSRENSVASMRSNGAYTPQTSGTRPEPVNSMPKLDEAKLTRPESLADISSIAPSTTDAVKSLHGRSKSIATLRDAPTIPSSAHSTFSPPLSPSKKWASKSTWIGSALSRPESPVPSVTQDVQPVWMAELSKAKLQRSASVLSASPVMSQSSKSSPREGQQQFYESPEVPLTQETSTVSEKKDAAPLSPIKGLGLMDHGTRNSATLPSTPDLTPSSFDSPTLNKSPATHFRADARPLSTALRSQTASPANAHSHHKSDSIDSKDQPEFRNALGSLRKTQTQNYVAPDVLKDNIMRGKAGLALTGGPVKTAHKDELKEGLVQRKAEIKAQPKKVDVSSTSDYNTAAPEALTKREQLGRGAANVTPTSTPPMRNVTPEALSLLKSIKNKPTTSSPAKALASESKARAADSTIDKKTLTTPLMTPEITAGSAFTTPSATPKLESINPITTPHSTPMVNNTPRTGPDLSSKNKIANRVNPALAGLLAKGPPQAADSTSKTDFSGKTAKPQDQGSVSPRCHSAAAERDDTGAPGEDEQLTHMTKSRAKGPKRRKPLETDIAQIQSPLPQPHSPSNEASSPRTQRPSVPRQKSAAARAASIEIKDSAATSPPLPSKSASMPANMSSPPLSTTINSNPSVLTTISSTAPSRPVTKNKSSTEPVPRYSPKPPQSPVLAARPVKSPEMNATIAKSPDMQSSNAQETPRAEDDKENQARGSVAKAAAMWTQVSAASSPILPAEPIIRSVKTRQLPITPAHTAQVSIPQTTVQSPSPAKHDAPVYEQPRVKTNVLPQKVSQVDTKAGSKSETALASARDTLLRYFGSVPSTSDSLELDVQKVLTQHDDTVQNVRHSKMTMQEINADGRVTDLPRGREYILSDTLMYICTHAYENAKSAKCADAFLWVGAKVSPSAVEDVQIFTKRAAKTALSGSWSVPNVQVVYQAREPASFCQALGGLMVVRMGPRIDNTTKPYILCGRAHAQLYVFDEVKADDQQLCSGFCYIAVLPSNDNTSKVILWKGAGCSPEAVGSARLTAMDLCPTSDISEVAQGEPCADLAASFPLLCENGSKVPRALTTCNAVDSCKMRLFRVDAVPPRRPSSSLFAMFTGNRTVSPSRAILETRPESSASNKSQSKQNSPIEDHAQKPTMIIDEILPVAQSELSADCLYILDAIDTIYVLPGPQLASAPGTSIASQNKYWQHVFVQSMLFANVYAIMATQAQERPSVPRAEVVFGKTLPKACSVLFRRWDEERGLWGGLGNAHNGARVSVKSSTDGGLVNVDELLSICCPQTA